MKIDNASLMRDLVRSVNRDFIENNLPIWIGKVNELIHQEANKGQNYIEIYLNSIDPNYIPKLTKYKQLLSLLQSEINGKGYYTSIINTPKFTLGNSIVGDYLIISWE